MVLRHVFTKVVILLTRSLGYRLNKIDKQCQAIYKSRNYAIIKIITYFLNNTQVFAKHTLYFCGLFYIETQSNILVIIISLQPELKNDI